MASIRVCTCVCIIECVDVCVLVRATRTCAVKAAGTSHIHTLVNTLTDTHAYTPIFANLNQTSLLVWDYKTAMNEKLKELSELEEQLKGVIASLEVSVLSLSCLNTS